MVGPVAGGGDVAGVGELAGEVGDVVDGGRCQGQGGDGVTELTQDGVHVGGVECVADGEVFGLPALCFEGFGDGVDAVVVAGDDGGVWGVECGDGDVVVVV